MTNVNLLANKFQNAQDVYDVAREVLQKKICETYKVERWQSVSQTEMKGVARSALRKLYNAEQQAMRDFHTCFDAWFKASCRHYHNSTMDKLT